VPCDWIVMSTQHQTVIAGVVAAGIRARAARASLDGRVARVAAPGLRTGLR